jgi:phage baseplate assembly protein gpV
MAISPTPTTYIKMVDGEIDIVATTIKLNGAVVMTGTVTSNGKNISSTHTHSGVQTGSGTTGAVS